MGTEAIDVGKERAGKTEDQIVMLSTGIRAKLIPVGASLIDDVVAQVEFPRVPVVLDEAKGREEENPNDPEYLLAVGKATRRRSIVAMDAMILFGMELVDGLPENDEWLKKLKWLSKRGTLDLSEYDLDDHFDLEFLYKRYIACGTHDLIAIGRKAGLNDQDIEQAAESFKS